MTVLRFLPYLHELTVTEIYFHKDDIRHFHRQKTQEYSDHLHHYPIIHSLINSDPDE